MYNIRWVLKRKTKQYTPHKKTKQNKTNKNKTIEAVHTFN